MERVPVLEKAEQATQLSGLEKILLLVPMLGGLFFGLAPLLEARLFVQFPADDVYVYQLTGAATLGYEVVFLLGVLRGDWLELRLPILVGCAIPSLL